MREPQGMIQQRMHWQTVWHNALRRLWMLLLALCAIVLALPQPIFAHPADQVYVVATFDVAPNTVADELRIHVQLQLGPLLGVPLWAEADRDQNGALDPAEISAWLPKFAQQNFVGQVDGERISLQAQLDHMGDLSAFRNASAQPQIKLTLHAPISRGAHVVSFAHQLNRLNKQTGFRADVASPAHAAFSSVLVDGARAQARLDTSPLHPLSLWQQLLMLIGAGSMCSVCAFVVVRTSHTPTLRQSRSGLTKGFLWLRVRSIRVLLGIITLLTTSNPTALPSLGVAAVGGCQIEPSSIWLKPAMAGGAPQQAVQVILPAHPEAATLAASTGSVAITDTAAFVASVNGTTSRIGQARVLAGGKVSLLVAVPPSIGAPVMRTIGVNTPFGACTQTVSVAQATQWNIYISQFGHPDAGWCTGRDYDFERNRHVKNQIAALDQISATLGRPFDNRQRWEADDFWQLDEALKDNPARAAQFQQYIQQGYYGLNPLYAPLLVQALDSESFLQGLLPYAHRERVWNLPKRTSAFLSEVPESTAGMPTLLNHAGITSFARGILYINGFLTSTLENRRVFWWQGPDGSKVLARMQADGTYDELDLKDANTYTYNDFANILTSKAATYENLKGMGNYPADAFLLFGSLFDCGNVDSSYKIGDFIQQWNNSVAFPHIVGGNQNEFFDYVAQNFGNQLQTYSGGFDTQWSDGLAFHTTTTAQFRSNAIGLLTAQKLSVIANAPGSSGVANNAATWLEAIKDHMLYAEHSTLANDNSCFSCTLQLNLQQRRAGMVRDVFTRTQALQTSALNALAPNISTGAASSPEGNPFVLVFNPLSWERSMAVTVTVNSAVPLYLTDLSTNSTIPSQKIAPNTLLFVAPNVPSLGYKVFQLKGAQDAGVAVPFTTSGNIVAGSRFSVTVDGVTGGVSIYDKFLNRELIGGASGRKANQLLYNFKGTLQSNTNIATSLELGPVAAIIKITGKPTAGNITGFTQTITLIDGLPFVNFQNTLNKTVSDPNCPRDCDLERIYYAYPINMSTPQMRVESNGSIVNVGTDLFLGAIHDYYGVQSFANVADANASVTVAMPDTMLVEFVGANGPRTRKIHSDQPAHSEMLALAYLNDLDAAQQTALAGEFAYRYALTAQGGAFDPLQSVRFGWEQRTPAIVSRLPANQPGALPGASRSYGQISAGNVVLSALKPAEDGNGFIARFWNPSTTPQQVNFDLSLLGATQGQYVDGMERPLATGGSAFAFAGAGTVSMAAQGFTTLRLMGGNPPAATQTPAATNTPVTATSTPPSQTPATPIPMTTPNQTPTVSATTAATAQPSATRPSTFTPVPSPQQTLVAQPTGTPTRTPAPTPDLRVLHFPVVLRDGRFPNATRDAEETLTAAPTATSTPTPTPQATTPGGTPAVPGTVTPTPTATSTGSITPQATSTQTPTPTQTQIPTQTPIPTATQRVLPVLDDFNRPDGGLGAKWSGFPSRFALSGNQLVQAPPTPGADSSNIIYFEKVLSLTQEVAIQIGSLGDIQETSEVGLMLRWQDRPGSPASPKCYAINVQYSFNDNLAEVQYCDGGPNQWESNGSIRISLAAGDTFSARVDDQGKVQVFKNGVLAGSVSVSGWEFIALPGRPGLWVDDVPGMTLDNFSGE